MPWKGTTAMELRIRFVQDYDRLVRSGKESMTELCRAYEISRKTGYKMVDRREEGGWPALADRSRAPHGGEHWSTPDLVMRVIELRLEFPHWGARTILRYLRRHKPDMALPSSTTAHGWLRTAGLIERPRRARRFPHPGKPELTSIDHPNQQWSTDFKGHFRTGDRRYCYALTVADSYSRYLLGCRGLHSMTYELVRPAFERLFREYGMPQSILSDNGSPFSSNSVRRLSKLSVWWLRLNVVPRLIEPGQPQQNGRHERIHGHMKPLVCNRPAANCRAQQKQFDWFQHHHNEVRPNESLHGRVPADLYTPSLRPYPKKLPPVDYPTHFEVRRVRSSGEIRWHGQWFFVSDALIGEDIAFEPVGDGCWIVRFASLELGYYSAPEHKLNLDRPRPAQNLDNHDSGD